MNSLRWRWFDDGLLPLLVVALRVCWLWPWLTLLQRWLAPSAPGTLVPLWALCALMMGGTLAARAAMARTGTLAQARRWVSGGGLAAVGALIWWQYGRPAYAPWDWGWIVAVANSLSNWGTEVPAALLTVAIAAGAWLRGVLDARRALSYEDVQAAFVTGCVAFAVMLLVAPLDSGGLAPNVAWWLMAFFAISMAALALASLELSLLTGRAEKETKVRLNRYWLVSVLSVIAVLLAIGLLISAVVAPETILGLLGWTHILLDLLWSVVGLVLYAVAYILFFLLDPLIGWLRERMAGLPPPQPIESMGFQRQIEEMARQPAAAMPPYLSESLRWLTIIGILAVIGLLFALALRYFRDGKDEAVDETRESVFSSAMVGAQLAAALARWRQRFRRTSAGDADPFLPLAQEEENRRQIRRVYQALLATAQAMGQPRPPAQTPAEYAARLGGAATMRSAPLETITAAYNQARYDTHAPSAEQAQQAQNAWSTLERELVAPPPLAT